MKNSFYFILCLALLAISCNDAPEQANNNVAAEDVSEVSPPVEVIPEEAKTTPLPKPETEVTGTKVPPTNETPPPRPEQTNTPTVKKVAEKSTEPLEESEAIPEQPTVQDRSQPSSATTETTENQPVVREEEPPTPVTSQPPSHDSWDKLLRQYVNTTGNVDYAGLKKDMAKLEVYIETLRENPPQREWSRAETMAYWINTYNAFTVKLILDNYPVSSITKLEGGKPWDKKWIDIGGKSYSLNNIENDILRPRYKDARIHFAVNCAAASCPPLLNRAWTAGNLESNFEKQARAFINNPAYNSISANKVAVSKIFDWYGEDFGNLIGYLNKYSSTRINSNAKVEFKEYDWTLNRQ